MGSRAAEKARDGGQACRAQSPTEAKSLRIGRILPGNKQLRSQTIHIQVPDLFLDFRTVHTVLLSASGPASGPHFTCWLYHHGLLGVE
ncbi:hypothetical protein R1flu_015410 [Riccia fluitans]|uniref:Uncharacterized protein n=1 Tax=Riccia fluitans TaxID=41844 RepID=A0ABD1YIW1_9MARC